MSRPVKIGIIGGSGLDDPDILEGRQEKFVETPFGKPSDALIIGKISGIDCILLARHGRKHDVMPTNVNYRANVWALKQEGCTHLVVTTACGSLQEEFAPGHIVFLNQFIDRTTKRPQSFFDGGAQSPVGVCHIPMGQPFCEITRQILIDSATELGLTFHPRGTNVTVEGPRFSSQAESNLFRSWGASVINMTTVPEVVLAREAGMCYASMALVTDYDCWRDNTADVNVETVMATMKHNSTHAKKLILHAIPKIADRDWTAVLDRLEAQVQSSTMLP